jgi:hypothetical protein
MKSILFAFLFIGAYLISFSQDTTTIHIGKFSEESLLKKFTFSGLVTQRYNQEKLQGVSIKVLHTNLISMTDSSGNFRLSLSGGSHILSISYLGLTDMICKINIYESGSHHFELSEKSNTLKQVDVHAAFADRQKEGIGLEILNVKQLDQRSKFLGETDVFRSLQSIAGVSSIGEGSAGINVRGGNTDENLIIQDQHLILNGTHALGLFSLTHPDMIEQISLYKGNMPSRYGGKLSSVLDIRLKEGDLKKFGGSLGLGIAASRFSLEGPIIKDKVSFIIGLRGSYLDWLLKQSKNISLKNSRALFYDGTFKVDGRVAKNTKVGASYLTTQDNFKFTDEVKFDYQTRSLVAYIKQIIGTKINLSLTLNDGQYNSNLFDIKSNDQSKFNTNIHYQRWIGMSQYQVNSTYLLELGIENTEYKVLPGAIEPYGTLSNIRNITLHQEQSNELNFFIHNKFSPVKKLEIELGLRYTIYNSQGPGILYTYEAGKPKTDLTIRDSLFYKPGETIKSYQDLQPRISFSYSINEHKSIKGGFNQAVQYLNQLSNTSSASPTDLWQLSNFYIAPQHADIYALGYYQKSNAKQLNGYVNVFYRNVKGLIDYKDFAVVLLNNHIESDLVRGKGKAYGFEFFINKQKDLSNFELSYTFTRSLRQVIETPEQLAINQGKWFPSNYDKPHVLNANYFVRFSPMTSLALNFTYSTGRPTTAPVGVFNQENIFDIPIYSNRNQFRIPDYHRLDVAYTVGPWGNKSLKHQLSFSIYNLYSRNNAYSVFFRQNAFLRTSTYRISVLGAAFPSINYSIKF